jgi:hypothetical protein
LKRIDSDITRTIALNPQSKNPQPAVLMNSSSSGVNKDVGRGSDDLYLDRKEPPTKNKITEITIPIKGSQVLMVASFWVSSVFAILLFGAEKDKIHIRH